MPEKKPFSIDFPVINEQARALVSSLQKEIMQMYPVNDSEALILQAQILCCALAGIVFIFEQNSSPDQQKAKLNLIKRTIADNLVMLQQVEKRILNNISPTLK